MRSSRRKRGATLLYVVVTGAGVATVLSGLTGFTAEVSRREGLNEEKATAIAALDGVQEMMRWEVRSMAYGGVEVDGYDENVETDTVADRATALPVANDAIRGIAGFVGSVSQDLPTNMIVPGGMTLALSSENINAFVENGMQSKRSERKTMTIATAYSSMSGATVAELGSDGLSFSYGRRLVIGVPWTQTTSSPRLRGTYYYMKGGTIGHLDKATGIFPSPSAVSGMVELDLGARGFPVATEFATQHIFPCIKISGFDPQTKEIQWWSGGFSGGRQIVQEFQRTDSFPLNWSNQEVTGSTILAPRHRLIHWSGSFNLAKTSDIPGASLSITTNGDTWVFINGKLSMDLGAVKPTLTSRALDRRWIQTGSNRIDIFYASRRGNYDFGLQTNLMFTPNEPVKIHRDTKFDQGWSTLTARLSSMSGVAVTDVKGKTDADDVDLGIEFNAGPVTRGVSYSAPIVSGEPGARFTQATATLVLFNTAWGLDLKRVIKVFQRDSASDSWRSVEWFATNSLDSGSYRRLTISTAAGKLKEKNLLIAFDGPELVGLESGVIRIADVAMVTSTISRTTDLFVPPYEERADNYALVAGKKISAHRGVTINGSVWGGGDLDLVSAPMNISKDLWLSGRVNKTSIVLSILNLVGLSSRSPQPPTFVMNSSAFMSRANMTSTGGTVASLTPPSGHSSVNLYSSNNLTINNLAIPSGGTIYVRGNLTIRGTITTDPGKELFLIVDGNVTVDTLIVSLVPITVSGIHVVATKKIEVKRPINWTGSFRSNDKVCFRAASTVTYIAPSMSPPGVATSD